MFNDPESAASQTPMDIRQGHLEHMRSFSLLGFQESTSASTAATMRAELNKMVSHIDEPAYQKAFASEMGRFHELFCRYMAERSKNQKLQAIPNSRNWDEVQSPSAETIIPYTKLEKINSKDALSKLAVLKLNGGLGTTMGCVGPKSAIEVRDGMTFLDMTVRQIEYLNSENGVDVPLILMNSFNTDIETKRLIQKYTAQELNIMTFNQSRFPRIQKDTHLPMAKDHLGRPSDWYPPGTLFLTLGHGDLFESLANSGTLDALLEQGKEYLFVSNIDNLGATVDENILSHLVQSGAEFIMEVTDKTKADIKGGTLIEYENSVRLLEIAQVPNEHLEDFKSIKKFKIFNTNNLWVNLKAIKRVVENQELSMEIIVNHKTDENGEKVVQLETAVGAAIKHFKGSHGINVPRSRFLPVKSTSDLFLITSDLYKLNHGELILNPKRLFGSVPLVKLGDHFKKVNNFLTRFQGPPHILELDHLTVTGDVTFGHDVVLSGTVIIVANFGNRIDIPSGAILHDKVVSGNLRILDH
ncbi:UTP-glucose-1-phosphate uridylyltransferase [Terramyces sp. JEL0728]|nr:UTP-glucose-1-phosphate uridylyltransferase [Terramyces sp. JEL0728]